MKSESQLMSELSHRTNYLRELSDVESSALKNAILNIYKDVATLCDKSGLTFMMCGGTCLGAIRHHGFIPWDDDLDIMMPRRDYNKLIVLLEKGELGEKYEFTYPHKNRDANNVFLKIFRKNCFIPYSNSSISSIFLSHSLQHFFNISLSSCERKAMYFSQMSI